MCPVIILRGDEWDDNGPNTVSDATITASANIPNWTTNFTDIITEPFTQNRGTSLPSVAKRLGYFNLLIKLGIPPKF